MDLPALLLHSRTRPPQGRIHVCSGMHPHCGRVSVGTGRTTGQTMWQTPIQYNTIQYNIMRDFVRRRSTNRLGAPYNNNNKSVHTIKQNSFKSFLEYVSVSNVMQVSWQSVPGGRTGVVEATFAKLGACSRQYVVSRVTRSESTCSRMKRSWRHSYSDIVEPDRYECSASEDITCTRFAVRLVANGAA